MLNLSRAPRALSPNQTELMVRGIASSSLSAIHDHCVSVVERTTREHLASSVPVRLSPRAASPAGRPARALDAGGASAPEGPPHAGTLPPGEGRGQCREPPANHPERGAQ